MTILTVAAHGWTAVTERLFQRDAGCIAPRRALVGDAAATDPCRDRWGIIISYDDLRFLERDHVNEASTKGKKAPDDEAHLVLLCPHHHRGTGPQSDREAVWATAHREAERDYLRQRYPEVWGFAPAAEAVT